MRGEQMEMEEEMVVVEEEEEEEEEETKGGMPRGTDTHARL